MMLVAFTVGAVHTTVTPVPVASAVAVTVETAPAGALSSLANTVFVTDAIELPKALVATDMNVSHVELAATEELAGVTPTNVHESVPAGTLHVIVLALARVNVPM